MRATLTKAGEMRLLCLGLTREQIYWIDHHFENIVQDLREPPRNADVRAELEKIAGKLAEIAEWCSSAKKSTLRQADKVALGHIGMAAATWARNTGNLTSDALPERMDLHSLTQCLHEIVELAKTHFPAKH